MNEGMSDVIALRRLGEELNPVDSMPSAAARHRLLAATRVEGGGNVRSRGRRRWVLWGGGLTTAAAGLLVAGLLVEIGGTPSAGVTHKSGVAPVPAAEPQVILAAAIEKTQANEALHPRANQFIYQEMRSARPTPGEATRYAIRRAWISVDGTHDGLLRERPADAGNPPRDLIRESVMPGCKDGKLGVDLKADNKPRYSVPCQPEPAYGDYLSADPNAIMKFLMPRPATPSPSAGPSITEYGQKRAADLLLNHYLPPKTLVVLFQAVAQLPHTTVVKGLRDASSRDAVAVEYSYGDAYRAQLIFDAGDYTWRGMRTLHRVAGKDTIVGDDMIIAVAIVDKVGQIKS